MRSFLERTLQQDMFHAVGLLVALVAVASCRVLSRAVACCRVLSRAAATVPALASRVALFSLVVFVCAVGILVALLAMLGALLSRPLSFQVPYHYLSELGIQYVV